MSAEYDNDDVLDLTHVHTRIPFEEVKRHDRGTLYPDPAVHVVERDPEWEGRLDVGNEHIAKQDNRRPHNPAFMNPADMERVGVSVEDVIEITSGRDSILAVVKDEPTLREGVVAISPSWGRLIGSDEDVYQVGSNPGRLIPDDVNFERYSGQPQMSNLPGRIRRIESLADVGHPVS
jgi:hypothetical protein